MKHSLLLKLAWASQALVLMSQAPALAFPVIRSFAPISGPVGERIRIRGTGLRAATAVKIGDVSVTSFASSGDSLVTAIIPSGCRTGRINVTTAGGSGSATQYFTVTSAYARIKSITPNPTNIGDTVLIKGKYLTGYRFVNFNGARALFTRLLTDSTLRAKVPIGATTGNVLVQGAGNQVLYRITINAITVPAINSFSSPGGAAGLRLRIRGRGLTAATAVRFGATAQGVWGTAATSFASSGDSLVTAIVPAGARSGHVVVVCRAGTITSRQEFTITAAYAAITSVSPASAHAGDTVRIKGRNFSGARAPIFGLRQAYYLRNYGDTLLKTVVPRGATSGRLLVQAALNQATFTYTIIGGDDAVARFGLDEAQPFAFSIYPNPSQGQATLRVTGQPDAETQLEVYTADGRLVHAQTLTSEADQPIQHAFAKGLYVLRAGGKTQRLVVE